ncbi:MAG: D-alanine--D-alanine ligase [Desulfobacterales bacterium]|jgi:D-alanine-D-alanine ligase
MKIGLTYDLRSEYLAAGFGEEETAEFDRDDTVVAIEKALQTLGHTTDRVGSVRSLFGRLSAGDRWDLVFNIAEGLNGIGREAQVPAALDVYGIPYTFSDPLVMALTLHKSMTKRVVRDAGIPTADFGVVRLRSEAGRIPFPPPYFIKPVAEGTGKGVSPQSIIRRPEDLAAACETLIVAFRQPVLVERYLPGREFTVGIVGTGDRARVLGTIEVHLLDGAEPEVYSYINKERCEELVEYRLGRPYDDPPVKEAEAIALRAWQVLECRDAGRIDLRCDQAGKPHFMEVNPLAGLHPFHSDLPIICNHIGMPYEDLIREIVESAAKRIGSRVVGKGAID